jgi:hypothetical protein
MAPSMVDSYGHRWERLSAVDPITLRWLCHGHVGLTVMWAIYARCVYEASNRNRTETLKVLSAKESLRLKACIESWVQRVLRGEAKYPEPVI